MRPITARRCAFGTAMLPGFADAAQLAVSVPPPEERDFGIVFPSHALVPNLTLATRDNSRGCTGIRSKYPRHRAARPHPEVEVLNRQPAYRRAICPRTVVEPAEETREWGRRRIRENKSG